MPSIALNSQIFTELETSFHVFDGVQLDYQDDFDIISTGDASAPKLLQLSASLIRFSSVFTTYTQTPVEVEYEIQISGSGIKPVSSLKALVKAIDSGLATGTLTKMEILRDGHDVLALSMGAQGYVLASGAQSLTVEGSLPLTFTQFTEFAGLFDQAFNIESMTRAERLALFNDFSHYGITGVTISDGADELFAFHIAAHEASLSFGDLTMTATGTFPTNFGEDLALLWEINQQFSRTGSLDLATLTNLDITGVKFTDAAGHYLGKMTNPMDGQDMTYKVDGKSYDEMQMGGNYRDMLYGDAGSTKSVLVGLSGRDVLVGFGGRDALYGGGDNDVLRGGNGNDLLVGGGGRDKFFGGNGADVFQFNLGDGRDRIKDFVAGEDRIEIGRAHDLSDLQMT